MHAEPHGGVLGCDVTHRPSSPPRPLQELTLNHPNIVNPRKNVEIKASSWGGAFVRGLSSWVVPVEGVRARGVVPLQGARNPCLRLVWHWESYHARVLLHPPPDDALCLNTAKRWLPSCAQHACLPPCLPSLQYTREPVMPTLLSGGKPVSVQPAN